MFYSGAAQEGASFPLLL